MGEDESSQKVIVQGDNGMLEGNLANDIAEQLTDSQRNFPWNRRIQREGASSVNFKIDVNMVLKI